MDQRIVQFVAALRANGVRISLAETADAFHGVESLGISDRDMFRYTLRATLVKENKDQPIFEKLFPLFFQGDEPPRMTNPEQDLTPEEADKIAEALKQFTDDIRKMLEKLMQGRPLNQNELAQLDQMMNINEVTDLRYQNYLTRQMEQALKFRQVQQALEELMAMLRQMGMDKQRVEQLQKMMEANQQALKDQLSRHVGQKIAENMSEHQHADRMDDLYNRPFASLSDDEMHQLRREVTRIAAVLRTRLALRLKRAKTGRLDVKSTLRNNQKYGSVPLELHHRDQKLKPKIVVICDISTSMRQISELMLSLLFAIQDQISKTQAFAFIDHIKYISPYFEGQQPQDAVRAILQQMPSGYYNTDLGASLVDFDERYLDMVDSHTTLIMVGDARNNYNDPRLETFRLIARRSRSAIWLNPEAIPLWGTGDSDMPKYAPLCNRIFQVSNLSQLSEAVDRLLLGR
ncbi:MAG TPA: VWA domain-containing protein [Anaerolineaceae bacterium]